MILIPLTLFLILITGYLLVLTLASWFYRPPKRQDRGNLSLGVVIPAHDEAGSIGTTIDAVRACVMGEALPIFVIADNCSDETAHVARTAGAQVLERHDLDQRGKGAALDWFLRRHASAYKDLDALCFIDADSRPDRDFFMRMADALADDNLQVVQGYNGVLNPLENTRVSLTACAFMAINHVRPAGASMLFGSTVLKGNGMALKTALLGRIGWPGEGGVEDLACSLELDRMGVRVGYQADAVIRSEMTRSRVVAEGQRGRWEAGRLALAARALPGCLLRGRLAMALDLLTPPLSLLVLLVSAHGVASLFVSEISTITSLGFILVLVFHVASALRQQRAGRQLWFRLLRAPLFVAWKATLYLQWMVKPPVVDWRRTQRNAQLKP